jgi:hypothetical protein
MILFGTEILVTSLNAMQARDGCSVLLHVHVHTL